MTEERDPISEAVKYQKELAEKRRLWEEQKQAEAEAEKRHRLQTSLEAHLKQRGELWLAATGNPPTREILERWRAEFVDERAAEQELDHELRLAQADDVWS